MYIRICHLVHIFIINEPADNNKISAMDIVDCNFKVSSHSSHILFT